MQQRIEVSTGRDQQTIVEGCSDLTLAIRDENVNTRVVLPSSVSRIQITGKESIDGLTLAGSGQTVKVVASNPRSIRELHVDSVVLEVAGIAVEKLYLSSDSNGVRSSGVFFSGVLESLSIPHLLAPERIIVTRYKPKYIGVFIDQNNHRSSDSVDTQVASNIYTEMYHLSIGQLRAPSLVVASGISLTLNDWTFGSDKDPINLVLSRYAILRLAERASIGPLGIDAPEGTLELSSAIAERVAGVLGCLATSGPCVFRGEGLQLSRLRCGADADISGVFVHTLDLASLSYAAQASAFDVILPSDRSLRTLYSLTASSIWWREPIAWRALYQQLEMKGRPATAAWARRMERETRRKMASRRSVQYVVLETAHLLGYGESVLRPLFAQAIVTVAGWAIIIVDGAYPAKYRTQDLALLLPRLYLAPLGVLRSGAFAPNLGTSIIAYLVWPCVALSGVVCFATAALAVKRTLAYL